MNALSGILDELWGLFVDDVNLALALVVWCGVGGLVLPLLLPSAEWCGPVLFAGCLAALFGDVANAVIHRK
jgi:hypothetical protein